MPDLSADRPLLLPDAFTEEDVVLVGDAIGSRSIARIALRVLGAAGRLLPPDAEHREEWTYTATIGNVERHGEDNAEAYETRSDVEQQIAFMRQHYPALPIADVRYVRRDVFTGSWVEVEGSTTDA